MFAIDDYIEIKLLNEKVLKYNLISDVVKELPSGSLIQEFGCGAGTFVKTLARQYPDCKFCGYDVDKKAVEYGKKFKKDNLFFDFVVQDQMNFIFAVDVLEHVDNIVETFELLKSKLKIDGIIVIHIPLEKCGIYRFDKCRDIKDKYSEHIKHYDFDSLSKIVDSVGLIIYKKYFHYHFISGFRDFLKYWLLNNSETPEEDKEEFYTVNWIKKFRYIKPFIRFLDVASYIETKSLWWLKKSSSGVTIFCRSKK